MRNGLKLLLFALLATFAGGAGAMAADPEPPPYEGMTFRQINGPADPEEYSWTVQLDDEQELKLIDDQHAQVYWDDGDRVAFTIDAQPAHDSHGTSVPTSIHVSDGDIITLTVHHRDGNPAAGGASFVYPITAGAGWEGGFQTHVIQIPPATAPPGSEVKPPVASCVVPKLIGRSLQANRKRLRTSGCTLGTVRGKRSKTSRIVKQDIAAGTVLPAGAKVSVKLG
jgi:hypothetical protein